MSSYQTATARQRAQFLVSRFEEILPPSAQWASPHLPLLDAPVSWDDGVVIGRGELDGKPVFIAAQDGDFMGGAVGEVHGAKLVGIMHKAIQDKAAAFILLAESGGVRLHEANAGLIAVSEVMRALFAVRAAGIPVIVIIGGRKGCFGGTGIIARCANTIIMSEQARLAMSGPEVIQAAHGAEELDASDRELVWRTTGGKHRYLLGDCDMLVDDDLSAFRSAAITALQQFSVRSPQLSLEALEQEQQMLSRRWQDFSHCTEPMQIWSAAGLAAPEQVAMLERAAFVDKVQVLPHRQGAK